MKNGSIFALALLSGLALTASAHLTVRPWSQTNEPLPTRVAADFKDRAHAASFVHYAVPAMSSIQRLPDVYPDDGTPGGAVRIVMARDEYEPGSFLVYGLEDLGKVQLSPGEFRTADGKVFPSGDLDLKVVKCWFQNRNAWYSYFGDTDFKLCPELLLNDEDLIRVDLAKKANYARAQILKLQLFRAVGLYKAEKTPGGISANAAQEGIFDHWQDRSVGDPAFYDKCLKPLVAELDAVAERVKAEMSDAEVKEIAETYLSRFLNIRTEVARLRADYLDDIQFSP